MTDPPTPTPHLQVHSHFTLLGATPSVDDLVARAAADGLAHLALTDTNALYGAVAFSRACRAAGIWPIVGMTIRVALPPELTTLLPDRPAELVLLAEGPTGYRSLCRLASWFQGDANREVRCRHGLPWRALADYQTGLLCLEGGQRGWLARLLRAGDHRGAGRYTAALGGLFSNRCYLGLELQPRTGGERDLTLARAFSAVSQRFGLPLVAMQPVYCLSPSERELLPLLAAIDQNTPLPAVPRESLPDGGQPTVEVHWFSPAEMAARFAAWPDALAQAAAVAARCQPALPDGRPIWPALPLRANETPDQALATQAVQGLHERYATPDAAGRARLDRELAAITRHGFAPLFLVVADLVRFAREADIPVSTRGSVANSLVAYCLGITTVDPLAHDLLFERFLNPARATLPDIDLDFCSRRRDEVLDYVRRQYGPEHVALVATVSTMRLKSAVRETGKAMGLDETAIDALARQLPRGWHPDPRRRDKRTVADILPTLPDARSRLVAATAERLVGQPHHLSIHPGGVVITPGPLTDFVPVQWTPKQYLITQYDHGDVEAIGLPKIDLLGIRALTVLADAAELVRQHDDPAFRLDGIPIGGSDEITGDILARGATIGVFQCESTGARRTLRQLGARTLIDLAVANAFFKPGPALGGMAQAFIRRYRGQERVTYLHPALEPILKRTQGVLLFQEQILRVAREIAGLSWAEADQLRRGMSKFDAPAISALQERFVAGCQAQAGLTERQATALWEQILPFAGYGFNQGHATAYAAVSYRSAYLKAHWPAAFLAARLANYGGFHHPAIYIAEARRLGIAVRPPHVNHSLRRFTLGFEGEAPTLWMGLGQVRDLRRAMVRAIVTERRRRPFTGLRDLLVRVPLQSKETIHLIQAGALDGLAPSRAALLSEARIWERAGSAGQLQFDFGLEAQVRPETAAERLAWERRVLGQPVSVDPLVATALPTDATVLLAELPHTRGVVEVAGYRLPGWTGSQGFFLSDGRDFVVARHEGRREGERYPPVWQPLRLRGRWREDRWGDGWFETVGNRQLLVDS